MTKSNRPFPRARRSRTARGKRAILCLCACGLLAAVSGAAAQSDSLPALFSAVTPPDGREAAALPGVQRIRFNSSLMRARMAPGSRVRVPMTSAPDLVLQFERSVRHRSGSWTWVARAPGAAPGHTAVITDDGTHVFGRIMTSRGMYLLRTVNGVQQLISPRRAGLLEMGVRADQRIPPFNSRKDTSGNAVAPAREPNDTARAAGELATVDLLLAYSTGLAVELGGGLQTRLDYLVALANQAYADSGINLRVRLVRTVEVAYSDTATANGQALDDLTYGGSPSLANLASLRDTVGADLVALLRNFQSLEQGSCGVAWVLGSGGAGTVNGSSGFAYSVSSDGMDGWSFCDDVTLAHELGHNMGTTHDRPNTGTVPVFPYAYGYGNPGSFGTVMSYIDPVLAVFSNPEIDCAGEPCGIAHPAADSADNARAINNVRFELAAFRPTQIDEATMCPGDQILTLENETVTGIAEETACAIIAGPSYEVTSTAELQFRARTAVSLKSGFRVQTGGRFSAIIDPDFAP